MAELAIEAKGVSKRFGVVQGLDALDLAVPTGQVVGFIGPNGAGKTTTLRCLLGLLEPDSGSVRVFGLDPLSEGRAVRRQVGVLLAEDGLYDRLSAAENLEYYGRVWHLSPSVLRARMDELLRSFDLWPRRNDPLPTWSTGMRRKLAISRALLHRPRLLLLDEPFSGLDPAAAVELRGRIAALAKDQGVTVLLTTHDLLHVEKCCTTIALINAGRVVATGSVQSLASRGAEADVEVEIEGEGLNEGILAEMKGEGLVSFHEMKGAAARIRCPKEVRPRLGRELIRRGVLLHELRSVRGSLEDVFLKIVARADAREAREG